jgi:predicted acyl esterase
MARGKLFAVVLTMGALAATPASAATERELTFSGTPGERETQTWTDTGSGVLASSDTMDAVGCDPAPLLHDCDDTVVVLPTEGVLSIRTSVPDDPAAKAATVDADLELYLKKPDGSLENLDESAGATPAEALSKRLPAGTYVIRIEYAIAIEGSVTGEASFNVPVPEVPDPNQGEGKHYSAQAAQLSQATHQVQTDKLQLPMADGRTVYIEVIRPTEPGEYGVILESSPYHGTLYDRTGARIMPQPLDATGKPQGLAGYFAPRGYAVVMMDLRGTGKSQGCLDHLGQNDASDLKTVIEWAASQPWSNGRVGMVGHSYVGSTPSVAAAQDPEGLVTIVPSAGLASMYDHQYQAGVPWSMQWIGPVIGYQGLAVARALPPDLPAQADPVLNQALGTTNTGDNFGNDPHEAACGAQNNALLTNESMASGQYVQYHRDRDWREGAKDFDGSVFVVHGANDEAARIAAMEWFYGRAGRAGDKAWIGQWNHGIGCCPNRRGMEWVHALHTWFDHELLQRDVDTGPAVEVFLNDEETDEAAIEGKKEVLVDDAWPPATQELTFHAQPGGKLGTDAPTSGDSKSFTGTPDGWVNGREGASKVEFVSEPLQEDILVVGVPRLELAMAQTSPRLHVIANLVQQSDGGRRRLGNCAMNPELREGLETLTPVVPGERMTIFPPCWTSAQELKKGNQLVLQVMTSDDDHAPSFTVDPNVTVFTGDGGTKVTLPVVADPTLLRDTADTTTVPDPGSSG